MPRVNVRYFGPAADLAAKASESIEVRADETAGGLAGILAERYPRLGASVGVRLAVNRSYVALDHRLADGDEVAVIPPVSGG